MKKENINTEKKQKIKTIAISFFAGAFVVTSGNSDENISTVREELSVANEQLEAKVEELETANNKIKELTKENKKLSNKLSEAEPFFEMKETERLELELKVKKKEEERVAKEKKEAEKKKKEELEKKSITLASGNYEAGVDFEGGKYDIVAISGNGNVSSSNIFSGGINAIMGTDGGIFEKEYKNIQLPKGTTLTISSVKVKLIPKE